MQTTFTSPACGPFFRPVPLFGWDRKDNVRHKVESGLTAPVDATYQGYTGKKNRVFPINPGLALHQYPNVTVQLGTFRDEIRAEIRQASHKGVLGSFRALKLLGKNIRTSEAWDTKFHPDFPGRDRDGNVQYAHYKGKVVSANYLSNNLYGQVMAALEFPLWFAQLMGRLYSRGWMRVIFNFEWPDKRHRQFQDPDEDQRAIESGYDDWRHHNPWRNPAINPMQPLPEEWTARRQAASA